MTFGARSGGFGAPGFGPYRTGGGDFSRYNIGDTGAQLDSLKRDRARIEWANGTITDDAYLKVLQWYANRQEKGSRERLSAQDDVDDATYSIGRNRRVRDVNNAATSRERIAALDSLIAYDQRRLRGMTARGRNEQARETEDRIADAEGQIREARYSDQVRRYNADRATTDQMLAAARRAARDARGAPDAQTWQDRVTEWEGRKWDEDYAGAQDAYTQATRAAGGNIRAAGDHLISMLSARIASMGDGSPQRAQYERQLRDLRQQVTEDVWNRRVADAEMGRAGYDGYQPVSDSDYIALLHQRASALPQGSTARKEARADLLNKTYAVGEQRIQEQLADGTLDPADAVPFYQGYLATMQPGTDLYRQIVERINGLRLQAVAAIPLAAPASTVRDGPGGHWVLPSGTPDGTAGFQSQFDGSAFATQNCMFAAGAMMLDALGGADLSGADLRRYAGDPDGAGFQSDVQGAYESIGFAVDRFNGMGFRQFMRRLDKSQGGAVVIGLLADLPQQYRLASGGGAHAVYVTKRQRVVDGQRFTWVMDPLGRSGYDGAWWPDEVMQQFAWSGARNPISGSAIYGSVVFGKRTGRSNVTYTKRSTTYVPRYQAFDTDSKGRSTIGRGGGTSRQEAGAVTDWRKGREPRTDPNAPLKGPKAVQSFLAAVGQVESGPYLDEGGNDTRGTPEQRTARAKALLEEYGGDARLATLAWFGHTPDPDTSRWSDSDRWYANAVATRLGYQKVPVQGIGVIGEPPAPSTGPAPVSQHTPVWEQVTRPSKGPGVADAMPAADAVARRVLAELGWPQTADMERAVTAWMRSESPSDTIAGNNPFGIRTAGPHDLPGQVGVDDSGNAIFGTLADGIRAMTSDVERSFPDIVAAGNSGSAQRLLTAVSRSDWTEGGYGDSLVQAYNQTPGDGIIVGGSGAILSVPTDLGDLSGQHSDVGDLFRIDPNDPAQMAWFERNLARAKDALDRGASSWMFETPGEVDAKLDFTPSMAAQLQATRADYYDAQALSSASPLDRIKLSTQAEAARKSALSMQGDIATDQLDRRVDTLDRLRYDALLAGDYATAMNASLMKVQAVADMLGVPDVRGLDVDAIRGQVPGLSDEDYDHLASIVESVDPDSKTGDPLLKLADKGMVGFTRTKDGSGIESVELDRNQAFVRQRPDGTPEVVTIDSDPSSFDLVTKYDDSGNGVQVPAYTQSNVLVQNPDGSGFYVPIESGADVTIPASKMDYAGYREPLNPGYDAPRQGPSSGIGQGSVLGSLVDLGDSWAAFGNDVWGRNPTDIHPAQRAQQPTLVTARAPVDGLVRVSYGQIPARRIESVDPVTGQRSVWYSLDGTTWVGGERDALTDKPPQFVLNPDSGVDIVRTGNDEVTFTQGGQPVQSSDLTPDWYAANFHIFGSDPRDNPNPNAPPFQGSQGSFDRIVRAGPGFGGGLSLDLGQADANPAVTRWRTIAKSGPRALADATARWSMAQANPNLPKGAQTALTTAVRSLAGAATPTLSIPSAKPGPSPIMASLARWQTGVASTSAATSAARQRADAQATIAAATRARANAESVARAKAAAAASADPTRLTRPVPAPTPKAAPPTVPTRSATPKPSPTPTPKPSAAPKPKGIFGTGALTAGQLSSGVGPKRV